MNDNECMCYITYAVPKSMLSSLVEFKEPAEILPQRELYPSGFVPQWYHDACFPEEEE